MLDIKRIKENPEEIIDLLARKGKDARETIERILELDNQRRVLVSETDNLKAKQNTVSKQIPAMKKAGQDTAPVFAEMNALKETIKVNDGKISEIEKEYKDLMLGLPNLPDPDLLPGGKENNQPLRYFGEPHTFDFEPKNHVDLCTGLNLIDYERGVKMGGNGFWCYKGMGARLEWALLTTLSTPILPTAMSSFCLLICWSTSAASPPVSSPSLLTRSIRSPTPPPRVASTTCCPPPRLLWPLTSAMRC